MRWSTLISIFCILVAVSANTSDTNATPAEPNTKSTDGVRQKRHLSTLLNIKKAIIGKVFGSSASAENYKLYRIPGHDNILIKAVPITVSENGEIPVEVPVNPTIALLQSYLGTNTTSETLNALNGVKSLLNSGIISNDALLNQLLVPVRPPKISYRVPQMPSMYSSVLQAPVSMVKSPYVVSIPLPPRPVITSDPIRVIPEAPVLPPPAFLPQVLVPPKPSLVRKGPVIVEEFVKVPRVKLTDYRPVPVPSIPSTPVVPVFGNHYPHYPGAYSYQQYNNDGTVTQYTDSKLIRPVIRPAVLPPLITERVQVISEKVAQKEPVLVEVPGNAYAYHQIKGGSIMTFGSPGKVPHVLKVIPEASRFPVVPRLPVVPISIKEPEIVGKNPAEYGPVHVGKISKSPNGFAYHQVHSDGSVSLFGDGSIPLARPVVLSPLVTDRINIISETIVKKPSENPRYSYHQIKKDGTVTTISGEDKKPGVDQVFHESPKLPVLRGSDVFVTEIDTPEFGPVKVQKIPKKPDFIAPVVIEEAPPSVLPTEEKNSGSVYKIPKIPNGFTYHQVYSDGMETTYTGDLIPSVVSEPLKHSPLFLDREGFERHQAFGPIVKMGKIPKELSGISYKQLHTGGLPYIFTDDKSGNPGYSYHLTNNEETITTVSGGDSKKSPQASPRLSTLLSRPDLALNHPNYRGVVQVEKIPKNTAGFSYQQVHSDGSETTFSGSNVQPSQRPILHPVIADRIQTISEKMNEGKVPVGNSGYTYQQINSQESVTTSGNNGKTAIPEPPKLSTLLNNEVTVTAIKNPQPTTNSQGGYSYHQSNTDGSETTFTGSDIERKESTTVQVPALIVNQVQPHQLIVGSLAGQDGQQLVGVFDATKKPASGFSYKQTLSGGSVNTYGIDDVKVTPIVSSPKIPAPPSLSLVSITGAESAAGEDIVALERPKVSCTKTNKCGGETKVTFEKPVVSTYEYKQLVHSNPNKKFTVVNVEDGIVRQQPELSESYVTVRPVTPSHVSRRPSYRRRTRPTSTESPLAENPIVVPEEGVFSYKQTSSDGSTTKIEGSDQQVTVSVSGEVRKTVHRGDIPE